ncbi:ABC transporter permease [Nakamurella lactea]|uniref:ABC transporter permease n=1 Tax=Nakamurella lactea TaxID=459515 RepID=UPI00041D4FAD|nr:ABC transporter permease [Nakamurella lactea]
MSTHRELTGEARPATLIREGIAITRSALGASITLAVIVAGLCVAVFATAGRGAAAERQVAQRIEQAGTRLITVQYTAPTGTLDRLLVTRAGALSQVSWAFGLGPASDASLALLDGQGRAVPARSIYGTAPPDLPVTTGRWPAPGEAVVSPASQVATGLIDPAGTILYRDHPTAVVGQVAPTGILAELAPYILVNPAPDSVLAGSRTATGQNAVGITTLYVLADRASDVLAVKDSLHQLLGINDQSTVTITASQTLADLGIAISGELGSSGRAQSIGVLAAGIAIIALSTYAAVAARKRDFGRRRALGAGRDAIIGLVLVQVAVPALTGALVGTAAGWILTKIIGATPSWPFTIAVAVLAVTAALIAAIPVSWAAARRDPVRILRIP